MRGAEAVLVVSVDGKQQGGRPLDDKLKTNGESSSDTEQISSTSESSVQEQPSCGRKVVSPSGHGSMVVAQQFSLTPSCGLVAGQTLTWRHSCHLGPYV
jgi:hypothetical protein